MKRKFRFGEIAYLDKNVKNNPVTVEMEYTYEQEKKCFSVSASVWKKSLRDTVLGGQCLEEIAPYIDNPVFSEILRLWRLYHLNDLHPECEHQAAAGWREKAREEVSLYEFTLNLNAIRETNRLKALVLDSARKGDACALSKDERQILNLKYSVKSPCKTLPEDIAEFYELKKEEKKALGWLYPSQHPDGILTKPCPVCGYKYGSAWNYFPIPAEDEKIIYKLLKTGKVE